MSPGETIQSAVWITGDEPEWMRKQYEQDVALAIQDACAFQGVSHGPVTFKELHPYDPEAPPVPKHINGSCVRILVAEAEILGKRMEVKRGSFINNLDAIDLERLRTITRRVWAKTHPREILTTVQCDETIESLGPEAALDTLRNGHRELH